MHISERINQKFNAMDKFKDDNSSLHDEIVMWTYQKLKEKDFFERIVFDFFPNLKIKKAIFDNQRIEIEKHMQTQSSGMSMYSRSYSKDIGFADLFVSAGISLPDKEDIYDYAGSFMCGIEVKTKINIGELLRQINFYKSYTPNWVVVSQETSFEQVLKEQGILFIKYKPDLI